MGYIVIGSKLYDYDILEAVQANSSPLQNELAATTVLIGKSTTSTNTKLKLLYLGYHQYYYFVGDSALELVYDIRSKTIINFEHLVSYLATPDQYKRNRIEIGNITMTRFDNPLPVPNYQQYGGSPYPTDCGPTTGAMISQYWKQWRPNLPSWSLNHGQLYITMSCNNWWPLNIGTPPWNFGPGWLQYAANFGYSGFQTDWTVNRGFDKIQEEINAGRPLGVMFSYNPNNPMDWHWCAVKGYNAFGNIIVNDPWTGGTSSVNWAAVKITSVITRIQNTN